MKTLLFSISKLLKRKRKGKSGISEIVATVLLVLIIASLMSVVYIYYNNIAQSQEKRLDWVLKKVEEENAGLDLIDSYYNGSSHVLTLCLYLREDVPVLLDRAYINGSLVPVDHYLSGFHVRLVPGEVNCIEMRVDSPLGSGFQLILVTEEGGRFEYWIAAETVT